MEEAVPQSILPIYRNAVDWESCPTRNEPGAGGVIPTRNERGGRLDGLCIIPAEAFWEPDWRSGKNVWTRIHRADGKPLGIAGL